MNPNYPHHPPHDVSETNRRQVQKLHEIVERIILYSALSVMVWSRPDIGARLLSPGIGLVSMALIFASWTVRDADQSLFCLCASFVTLILGMRQRFSRWGEFRRGVRHFSYSLGTTNWRRRLPAFLCQRRYPERFVEPLLILLLGLFLHKYVPPFGAWLIFAAICLGFTEQKVFVREQHEQRDLVDGMVRSEIQTETVEKFSEPLSNLPNQHTAPKPISTGLSDDIAGQIQKRRSRPSKDFGQN